MEKHQHTHHQTRRESLRKYYQIWEGKNVLLCKGNFMIGASIQPVIYTLMLINVPAFLEEFLIIRLFDDATFVGTLVPYIIFHVLSNLFMMRTILTDPGIIRRYNSKYVDSEELSHIPQRKIQALAKRNPCELTLSNHLMRFKYCRTCHIYRPLRTTHCHECDNCVERFDHHCPWLGVCVGKRNYRNFFMFVMSSTILIALSIFISLYRMLSSWRDVDPTDFGQFLKKEPYTIISLAYSAMFSLFLAPLFIFHIWLIKNNMTTNEFWKNTWKKVGVNPYKKKNFWSNCTSIMCLPIRASFIQFKKIVYPNQPSGKDQQENSSVFAKAEVQNQITLGNEKGRATPDQLLQRKESDKSNTQTNLGQHDSKEENEIQLNGGPNNKTPPSSAGNDDKNRGESALHSGVRNSGSVFNMHGEPIEIVARGSGYDVKSPMTVNDDLENEKSPLSGFPKSRRVKPLESGSVYGTPDTYSRHNSERRAADT